jgi:ribosomal protein S27AE
MDAGAILLLAAVLLIVSAVVVRPLIQSSRKINYSGRGKLGTSDTANHQLSVLLAEKERLLNTIQEMDFDHETGKIPDELFTRQREELVHTAAGILKQLAELGHVEQSPIGSPSKQLTQASTGSYDDLDEMIAKRKLERNTKPTGFCPKCGQTLHANDRFCPKCGTTILTKK